MTNSEQWTSAKFFERLDSFLITRNWKLTDLGTATEITTQSLYAMRKRNALPSLSSLCTICDALDISLSEFFNLKPDGTPEAIAITQRIQVLPADVVSALSTVINRMN